MVSMIFTYATYTAMTNVMPMRLRARSSGLILCSEEVFGALSPLAIGAVSDAAHSLREALNMSTSMLLLSAVACALGALFLEPVPLIQEDAHGQGQRAGFREMICG